MSRKELDLTGQRYGRLVLISRIEPPEGKRNRTAKWLCRCDCGNNKAILLSDIRSGKTKSCGCIRSQTSAKNMARAIEARSGKPRKHAETPTDKPKIDRNASLPMTVPIKPTFLIVRCCKCRKKFERLSPQWAYKEVRNGKIRYGCSWKCWNARDAK